MQEYSGFKKQEADNYGKIKEIPDWKKFFDNDNQGDIVGTIYKKAYGFTGPGSHTGSILNVNHAYFILLQTFSLIHIVISRFTLGFSNSFQKEKKQGRSR
jgi:hypothetical protein